MIDQKEEDEKLKQWFISYCKTLTQTKNDMFYVDIMHKLQTSDLNETLRNGLKLCKMLVEQEKSKQFLKEIQALPF